MIVDYEANVREMGTDLVVFLERSRSYVLAFVSLDASIPRSSLVKGLLSESAV